MATTKKTKSPTKAKPALAKGRAMKVSFQTTGLPEDFNKKLPAGTVKAGSESSLVINVEKLSKSLMRDQRARMISSMGCYSNPGGPGC